MHCESFREERVKAERRALEKSSREEVTLDEIYSSLPEEFSAMKGLEAETEIEAAYPNKELAEFYGLMLEKGKRVIITSDMYLPEGVIAKILAKCGYAGYEGLYVSSAFGLSKRRGGLFRKILQDKDTAPSSILHIGDHVMSDYLVPRRLGIKSFLYRKRG